MRTALVCLGWALWLVFATVLLIMLDGILETSDAAPRSTVVNMLGGYDSGAVLVRSDASMLAWACERILPVHLGVYVVWRAMKATLLR